MARCSWLLMAMAAVVLLAGVAWAQPGEVGEEEVEAAGRLRVYLVTIGPGKAVWEQFGHNAIQIVDAERGRDFACNWGVFDFFEEGFYRRFVFGRMLYRMEAADGAGTIDYYRECNRSVYRQELDLTARQKAVLYGYVAWNSRPENREYRYDYYRDNCSTRVRDVIDRALGGEVAEQLRAKGAGVSYRWHTRRIMAGDVPLYTSLLFILGQPVDREISAWEEAFLPLELMEHLRGVTVVDEEGKRAPLVKSEEVVFEATQAPQRAGPPNWLGGFLAVGLICAGVFYGLTRWSERSRVARVGLLLLATVWALFVGLAGSFALWGWTSTEHVAVYRNENLMQFFPPAIVLGVLIPWAARRRERVVPAVRWMAWGVPAASVAGLLLKALPAFRQVNFELIAWVLPVHVAFAYGVWREMGRAEKQIGPADPA